MEESDREDQEEVQSAAEKEPLSDQIEFIVEEQKSSAKVQEQDQEDLNTEPVSLSEKPKKATAERAEKARAERAEKAEKAELEQMKARMKMAEDFLEEIRDYVKTAEAKAKAEEAEEAVNKAETSQKVVKPEKISSLKINIPNDEMGMDVQMLGADAHDARKIYVDGSLSGVPEPEMGMAMGVAKDGQDILNPIAAGKMQVTIEIENLPSNMRRPLKA